MSSVNGDLVAVLNKIKKTRFLYDLFYLMPLFYSRLCKNGVIWYEGKNGKDMKKIDTFASIKKQAITILKRHSVKHAAIFGSFARGDAKANSDVDFLIEYKGQDKSLSDLFDLKLELEDSLAAKSI